MFQEPQDSNEEKPTASPSGRVSRKEVDLFPVSAEKKVAVPTPTVSGGVSRLGTQISIFNPLTFDEALDIVSCLRSRYATTISLDKMRKSDAGRLVDFVSGASAALDGDFHKLTEQVYVFCPSNIRIVPPTQAASTKSGANAYDFLLSAETIGDKRLIPRKN